MFYHCSIKSKNMKKISNLLLIMLCSSLSIFAGSTDKNDATIETSQTPKGGTWTITIQVGDLTGKPISGATVSAPCTGLSNKTTNSSGQAIFGGSGDCPCAEAYATVTTSKGCDVEVSIVCNDTTPATCTE